nr:unnamed protein product [Digitaria exilis]
MAVVPCPTRILSHLSAAAHGLPSLPGVCRLQLQTAAARQRIYTRWLQLQTAMARWCIYGQPTPCKEPARRRIYGRCMA